MYYRIFKKNGEILVTSIANGREAQYQWFGIETLMSSSKTLLFAVNKAVADSWPKGSESVILGNMIVCRQRLTGSKITVRVGNGSGRCYDEVIDTGSGRVLSREAVSCHGECN